MESRTGLIERAAALLREAGQESPAHPPAPPAGAAPPRTAPSGTAAAVEARSAAVEPLSDVRPPLGAPPSAPLRQSVVLDRNHLARTGIMMPWTVTARVVEEFRIVKRNIMATWQLPDNPGR